MINNNKDGSFIIFDYDYTFIIISQVISHLSGIIVSNNKPSAAAGNLHKLKID